MTIQMTRLGVEQIRDGARERLAGLMLQLEALPDKGVSTGIIQADANSMGVLLALATDWLEMAGIIGIDDGDDAYHDDNDDSGSKSA